jgi:hypothetical protein
MNRQDLKDIILAVIDKMQNESPRPACAFLWSDDTWGPAYTTYYGVSEEDGGPPTTVSVGEEDPDSPPQ